MRHDVRPCLSLLWQTPHACEADFLQGQLLTAAKVPFVLTPILSFALPPFVVQSLIALSSLDGIEGVKKNLNRGKSWPDRPTIYA